MNESMKTGILLIFLFLISTIKTVGHTYPLNACFTGDVMFDRAVEQKIKNGGFSFITDSFNRILKYFPYRVVNLECPITNAVDPINKKYNFRVDTSNLELLKIAGNIHAGLADNHINDQNQPGAIATL